MTDRLWNYLESKLNTQDSYLEIETDFGKFIIEPIYYDNVDYVIGFTVSHGSYWTTTKEDPDIWFWEEIEKNLLDKEN